MVNARGNGRATMPDRRVRAGLLGIDGSGVALLEALRSCELIELIALADNDRDLAKIRASELGVEAYDDYRSFVVEQPMDALFVSVPPFACHEHLKLAASRGVHVWRVPPLARTVHEAEGLIRAFEKNDTRLAAGRRWQFLSETAGLADVEAMIGRPYAARGVALVHESDPLAWRGDSERAGGGVLIDRAYGLIDAIVQKMHLPDEVQATTARRSGTQPYDTEDVASATLRYQSGAMAAVFAHRRARPTTWSLVFDGPEGSLILEPPRLAVQTTDGAERVPPCPTEKVICAAQVQAFAQAILTEAKTYPSPASQHLATVAVIETAYLSARTGEPESPAQLYHLHDLPMPPPVSAEEEEPEGPSGQT